MKIVEPQVELWKQELTLEGAWHQIARATRVCYQSKPKDNETDEAFVDRVILKPARKEDGSIDFDKCHGAMLEHGTIYLTIPGDRIFNNIDIVNKYIKNKYSRVVSVHGNNAYVNDACITTNMRVIIENNWQDDLNFISAPTHHIKRTTFSVITDIGITRELNRHRTFSIAEQSTRYCDLTRNRFGDCLSFPVPSWINKDSLETSEVDNFLLSVMSSDLRYADSDEINNFNIYNDEKTWNDIDFYIYANIVAQYCYKALRNKGWRPEQARQVLPLGLKTQAVYTAFDDDWQHFIKLRADNVSGKVHPNMKIIADKIKELFNNK